MNIKRRLTAIVLICSFIVLVIGEGRSPTTVFADTIEHTHIWATTYDKTNHWEYCTVCGEKRNVTAHVFTDHWYLGYESCSEANYDIKTCACGYSYQYRKPHTESATWHSTGIRLGHYKSCLSCGAWTGYSRCYNDNGFIGCTNPGTCKVCGNKASSSTHYINNNGVCALCHKQYVKATGLDSKYSSDYKTFTFSVKLTPCSNEVTFTNTAGVRYNSTINYLKSSVSASPTNDGTGSYVYTYTVTFKDHNSGINYFGIGDGTNPIRINGAAVWYEGSAWCVAAYKDHIAPVITNIEQKDQTSANGWATIKQITVTGTEENSNMVYLTIKDKMTGEAYLSNATIPVTNDSYSFTCTPPIEGDANGRTYVATVKDRIGNVSAKEFVVSKTDGSGPKIKNGTSLTYTNWTTSKNISLSFYDFGAGGAQVSLDDQTDYKPLTKNGEYYVWNHKFGNQVGTSEHTIYVKDALGNATSYKLTVGNTDSNIYNINYNLNGGTMSGQKRSYTVTDSFTLSQPTKTGYTFTGWTGSNGSTANKSVFVGVGTRGNLTYTANYVHNNYNVTIMPNGGSLIITDLSISKNVNGSAVLTASYDTNNYYLLGLSGSRNGYKFAGVSSAANGGTKLWNASGTCLRDGTYWDSNNKWKYPGNVTLYAQWTPITWTVNYDANGGSGTMANSNHMFNSGSRLRKNTFTRTGWTFAGWTLSRVRNGKTEWLYGTSDGKWRSAESWYELGKNPAGTVIYKTYEDGQLLQMNTYVDGDIQTAHAQWTYNPIQVKIPQTIIGSEKGASQFRIKCDDLKAGNIKVTVPNRFLYKQAGKTDITAAITAKSGSNVITPSNKVCVYDITTKSGLTAGCWSGNFNIGLTLTKE